jgi:hypothetical protein
MTFTGAGFAAMVIAALEEMLESAREVAIKLIPAGLGTLAGAVYVMAAPEALVVAEIDPHALSLQLAPERVQLTPLFCASF